MAIECPKCHSSNPETQRFCGDCGTSLAPAADVQVSHTRTIEPPREELTTGSIFAGRYQIIEELGRGGMGRVYKAIDQKINEEVAIKLIKPEIASEKKTLERFGNELKIARRVSHKNVGRMYHLSEDKGTHYITMEYIRGEDLKRMIRMSKQMSIATAVDVAKQVAEGLAEAHRLGVVHRDLKPGNVMIDRDGNARIMDFGIARLVSAKGITGAGVAVGTPDYMSPEQVEGKEVDGRADIYSLGIMLYEMVTGRVPFEADTALAVGYKHKNEKPLSPKAINPQVPDDLDGLILKCLEKEPGKRFQTADELRAELERIEKGLPTTSAATTPAPNRTPLTSREITIKFTARKLLIPGLAFIGVVTAIVLAVLFLPHRAPAPKAAPIHKQITFVGTASHPAISPDGRYIAYSENISSNESKVVVQDLAGGQTIEIARGQDCGGPKWSPDGSELLFRRRENDGTSAMWISALLGGKPRRLEAVADVFDWSPDGSQFAFWSDEKKQLSFANKITGESKSISLGESFPIYATGLDWSPSGKFILLSTYDEDGACSVWTVTTDGSRQNKIIEDPSYWIGEACWSPRGDAIYYVREREQTADIWKIFVSSEAGKPSKPPTPILEGQQIGDYLTLTRDGKSLAYTREIMYSNLWLASLEGSGKDRKVDLKQLTTGTLLTMAPCFSPDGKFIAYGRGSDTMNIFVMPADGGTSQQVTFMNSWNYGPVWSPDGTEIAFSSNQGASLSIWEVSASGGVTPRQFIKAKGSWPAWAPSAKIHFQDIERSGLLALDQATGEVAPLIKSEVNGIMLHQVWSPDGKRVVFRAKKGPDAGIGIWILSLEDSTEVLLRKGEAIPFGWSLDGKWIYVWETISGGGNILTVSPENGRTEVLFTLPLSSEMGRLILRPHTIDGKHFVFEGRKSQSDIWMVENFDPEIK